MNGNFPIEKKEKKRRKHLRIIVGIDDGVLCNLHATLVKPTYTEIYFNYSARKPQSRFISFNSKHTTPKPYQPSALFVSLQCELLCESLSETFPSLFNSDAQQFHENQDKILLSLKEAET